MNKNSFGWMFAISDFVSAALAWTLFYIFRKVYIEPLKFGYDIPIEFTQRYFIGILVIPLFWLFIYFLFGSYKRTYRRSRLKDLVSTITISFFGSLLIFFFLILDDVVYDSNNYRSSFIVLFLLNTFLRFTPRFIILNNIKAKIRNREISFNSLLVGANARSIEFFNDIESEKHAQGYLFRGIVPFENDDYQKNESLRLPVLGGIEDLPKLVEAKNIEELIVVTENNDLLKQEKVEQILNLLSDKNVILKILPDTFDIISGRVKMKNIYGSALIEIWPDVLPPIQKNIKRLIDIVAASTFLILSFPLLVAVAILVKLTSRGPVFFTQERVGQRGKVFEIIKFRSMYIDAEKDIPQLSSKEDPRITKIGRVLRKYRLDEFPQFINVLKGEMSLVGPRPERQYYIDKITEKVPHYQFLLKIKPGITSWGMVKFGYAENVNQMIQRLKYDMLYLENMSIAMDFKILAYTVLTVLKGSGK